MLGRHTYNALISVSLVLLFSVVFLLWSRVILPWSYILLALAGALILVAFLFFRTSSKATYFYIVALAFLLRSLFDLATSFRVIPLYDGYLDLAALRIFSTNGRISVIDPGVGVLGLSIRDTSTYPLSLVLALVFSSVTGINDLVTTLFLPYIFTVVAMSSIFLLGREVARESGIGNKMLPFLLLLFAVSPDTIYDESFFHTRFYAYSLFYLSIFLVYLLFVKKEENGRRKSPTRLSLMLILLVFAIALSHSLTPLIFSLFLFGISGFTLIVKKVSGRFSFRGPDFRPPSISFILLAFCSFAAWLLFYANKTFEYATGLFSKYFEEIFMGRQGLGIITELARTYAVDPSLTPRPFVYILYVRDVIIYGAAIIGFVLLVLRILKNRSSTSTNFILFSTFSLSAVFILMNVINLKPLVMKSYAIPFILILAAFCFASLFKGKLKIHRVTPFVRITLMIGAVILVLTAFLAPMTHDRFEIYNYDPAIKFEDLGLHNPFYTNMKFFLDNYTSNDMLLLSDDPQLLYALLNIHRFSLIRSVDESGVFGKENTYFIEFAHLIPHGYYLVNSTQLDQIKADLPSYYNQILDSQDYSIHLSIGS